MARILDFKTKYASKIFAIDPAFAGVLGWAILNRQSDVFGGEHRKPLIHRSGVLKPFSSESSLRNMMELSDKVKEIWHADVGFSWQPEVLVIERPVIYPGSPVKYMSLMDLTMFVGILSHTFRFQEILIPTPLEWKNAQKKEQTKDEVINFCDHLSMKNIARDIESVSLDKRHNIFDAMGLGIYGSKVLKGEIPPPRMRHKFN